MSIVELLDRLEAVKRCGQGWLARCPVHEDRRPSFTIREGERGLLLKCWAGCSLEDICAALSISIQDLFNQGNMRGRGCQRARNKLTRGLPWRVAANRLLDAALARRLRGERVLSRASELDLAAWTDADIEAALKAVSRARDDLAFADVLEDAAFLIRLRGIEGKDNRGAA